MHLSFPFKISSYTLICIMHIIQALHIITISKSKVFFKEIIRKIRFQETANQDNTVHTLANDSNPNNRQAKTKEAIKPYLNFKYLN